MCTKVSDLPNPPTGSKILPQVSEWCGLQVLLHFVILSWRIIANMLYESVLVD